MKSFSTFIILFMTGYVLSQTGDPSAFLVKPYLQVGSNPSPEKMQLLWHTTAIKNEWMVEYKVSGSNQWQPTPAPVQTKLDIAGIEPFMVWRASFAGLMPGSPYEYRILKNKKLVFTAQAKASPSAGQSFRFVASGDMGAGTTEAKEIANGIYRAQPDLVAIAGDIVYEYGLISEYTTKFWPIYNAYAADTTGVPLMQSIPFISAVGNHDADTRDLNRHPDALAYYHFWDQPLNGPDSKEGGPITPVLIANDTNRTAFLAGAGDRYPQMANYSYNYGNAHWTVIDADTYVDWTDGALRDWVRRDLAGAKDATWKFVLYHHPGFNSAREHFEQQQMRILSPIFDSAKVDIVFNGHVHNYQRSFPMSFMPDRFGTLMVGGRDMKTPRGRVVNGKWKLDKSFDGRINTRPNGVIYVITGAGGQTLYNPEQQNDPDSWQKFTDKFISTVHTFSIVDIHGTHLKLRQVTGDGREVDSFEINKDRIK